MYLIFSLALAVIFTTRPAAAGTKYVFAHFIAGNAASLSTSGFESDFALAKTAGIDAFAMNIAYGDSNTGSILATAYSAASTAGFKLFLNFDYLADGAWDATTVTNLINQYKGSAGQFLYEGKPFVSTFEGTGNIDDWTAIKANTGCFFVPDWSSLGPSGFANHVSSTDGAFSWDAWPTGAMDMTTDIDQSWMDMLSQNGKKAYLMPVSPWFYTNLPQYSKNWLWRGDDLWHLRWQQAIALQAPFVEIISWNDFGESHYIGPIHSSGIPSGADYATNNPHQAWLNDLPNYIAQYKSNNATIITSGTERITYWYKPNPAAACANGGTPCNDPSYQNTLNPGSCATDQVFVSVFVTKPSTVTVQVGTGEVTTLKAVTTGINHFSVTYSTTGAVKIIISRGGATIAKATGTAITSSCSSVNWNAIVGSS